ncbi:hypothetical protein [Methylobacterium fujisawaense]|uniref:hypothetical protein n=1 Tax=Methylobacterium fujisawaense TaxID=107400 RepID=UPI00313CF92F
MPASAAESVPFEPTPLHDLHLRLGARMVPFAGYAMPVQYPAGPLKEHLHARAAAGLFDVSHMGQIALRADDPAEAARALEALMPTDVVGLPPGRQRYGLLTDEAGGILDDLMVANLGDRLVLVVNAARKGADAAHLQASLPGAVSIEKLDRGLLALQGPAAELCGKVGDDDGLKAAYRGGCRACQNLSSRAIRHGKPYQHRAASSARGHRRSPDRSAAGRSPAPSRAGGRA